MSGLNSNQFEWLRTGDEAFASMLDSVERARSQVVLETYIYAPGPFSQQLRDALIRAAERGVGVRVLIDAWGSQELDPAYWDALIQAGGEFRWFNRGALTGLTFRDHRKILVCDRTLAHVGGFNIASEYEGDGRRRGWRDLGLRVEGPMAETLCEAFETMWEAARMRHPRFMRLRRAITRNISQRNRGEVLLGYPGRGQHPFKRALLEDLRDAREVRIMSGYFLPTLRIRRALRRVLLSGGKVQLILPGKSDVAMSQSAAQFLYDKLLRAGVEIFEYQPQILHAKLILIDQVVYVGSSNLDTRSLNINYEVMLRIEDPGVVGPGRVIFDQDLLACRRITLGEWRKSQNLCRRLQQAWAFYFLSRVDLYFANKMWRRGG